MRIPFWNFLQCMNRLVKLYCKTGGFASDWGGLFSVVEHCREGLTEGQEYEMMSG